MHMKETVVSLKALKQTIKITNWMGTAVWLGEEDAGVVCCKKESVWLIG